MEFRLSYSARLFSPLAALALTACSTVSMPPPLDGLGDDFRLRLGVGALNARGLKFAGGLQGTQRGAKARGPCELMAGTVSVALITSGP